MCVMSKLRPATTALAVIAFLALGTAGPTARSEEAAPHVAESDSCQRSSFRVMLDVGHTVDVPGADSARGVPEYTFNLQLADATKQALVDAGFEKTVRMITAMGPPLGLVQRAERANDMHADLFIAIHHDSVPDNLKETWEYEGKQHEFSDRFKGYSIFISNENGDREGSLQFGHLLGKALQARGLQYTPHYTLALMGRHRRELVDADAGVYRFDQLIVLRSTRMPAVLLEAGSIINRDEELELASPERRALASAAIAAAVAEFCTARGRVNSERHSKRLIPAKTFSPSPANPPALTR
jgi:N-acetylmuramoyl-L-alanine amidase